MIINSLLAEKDLGTIGKGPGFGPWIAPLSGENADPTILLSRIISNALGAMTIGAGLYFLFQVIIAGYNYMNAAGDKTRIENAGRKLTNSLIGLAIVVAAYGLLALIGSFLGIEFLNIGGLFKTITNGRTE